MLLFPLFLLLGLTTALEFKILHINDMHARVEGMRRTGGCVQAENDAFECDGGWARMLTAAKSFVQEASIPVVFIDNGDQFSGTPWSTFYRGQEAVIFKNKFCREAGFFLCLSGLGNHEFDFGYEQTLNYVQGLEHDVIVSNLDDTCEDEQKALGSAISKSLVVTMDGVKVGFVGYVVSDTPNSSSPPDCLLFETEESALAREITSLKEAGVEVLIGIGHSGLAKETAIAELFQDDLDIIVSGHSHSFLWTEEEQGPVPAQSSFSLNSQGNIQIRQDTPVAEYPTVGSSGGVPVVQAFFGSRYLGAVGLSFDESGSLLDLSREIVILSDAGSEATSDGFVPDDSMLEEVNALLQPLTEFIDRPIADVTRDLLDTVEEVRRIRQIEMPLGNVACDAMLANAEETAPGQIQICMQNGGGIRAPLFAGQATFGDIITIFPFGNVVTFLNFSGSRIHDAVEFGLAAVPEESGAFLHFSKGFKVVYDPLLDPLQRVLNISLNGQLIPNDESVFFGVVTNEFTASGGDGFNEIFSEAEVLLATGQPQENVMADYLQKSEGRCFKPEGRIVPVNNPLNAQGEEVILKDLAFDQCLVEFTIVHINDMHARVQGMRGTGGCTTAQNLRAECDGGWARLYSASKRVVEATENPVIFIDNGDQFSGTVWSTFYKGQETATFLNHLCKDRVSGGVGFEACFSGIGNHEFDFGYFHLLEFGKAVEHDILTSNIKDTCAANSQGFEHVEGELGDVFLPKKILEVQGKKIAIIGYTLEETKDISSAPDCMIFEPEADALTREIEALKAEGIDLIIATGHSGIQKDIALAAAFEDIDLIVGGHTHTFLWDEEVQGPIPAQSRPVLNEANEVVGLRKDELISPLNKYPRFGVGSTTPVLQSFFGSRYMGALDLTFDFEGNLVDFEVKSVLLGNKQSPVAGATEFDEETNEANTNASRAFEEDESMSSLVNELLAPLEEFSNTAIGEAFIDFESDLPGGVSVRNAETPLGNLVCDAMMHAFNSDNEGLQVDICFQNGGGIRAPIAQGLINFGNVIEVHPFGNVLSVLEFTGSRVHAAVEFGLDGVASSSGAFLAVGSGMEIKYDPSKDFGERILSVELNGELVPNNDSKVYNVVTNNFIADGGDGFGTVFSEAPRLLETGPPQEDSLVGYLSDFCPVCSEVEGRVQPNANPISVDGAEIDILGLITPSCIGVSNRACVLDNPSNSDSRTLVMLIVTIVCLLAVVGLLSFVYRIYDESMGETNRSL